MGEGAAVPQSRKPTERDSFESAQATADLFGVALEKSASGEQHGKPPVEQRARLGAVMAALKEELGDNPDLLKQALADFSALDRQNLRNHFEARQEYVRQMADLDRAAYRGIVEYGLQTLKWSFLLSAGAIAIVVAYVGGAIGRSTGPGSLTSFAPLLKALWPFAAGCVAVVLAGATGFFNFSYASASLPSAEMLHNFTAPNAAAWPIGKLQKPNELPGDFYKRFSWKVGASRKVAIALTLGSGLFFVYGVYRVLRVILV
jgi:hypothetical protein